VGLLLYIKQELNSVLKFDIKKDSQFILWFQLSKTFLKLDSDLVFGCVYIPPENSKYSSSDTFDEIENELISIINVDKRYIALTGDFNSKTGTLNDYIEPDDSILDLFDIDIDLYDYMYDLFDIDTDLYDYMYDFQNMLNHEIPLKSVLKCKGRTNNYGHKLLEVCKWNNFYIANSRIGSDVNIGERTCNDATVLIILF
jgi:hypothetical protein